MNANAAQQFEEEIMDLQRELANFEKEKERVRAIIGKAGGVPEFRARLITNIFIAVVAILVLISLFLEDQKWHLLMIEMATVTLSIKIIYLMHYQMRVNHFQFWILSAIEWRINEMISMMTKDRQKQNDKTD